MKKKFYTGVIYKGKQMKDIAVNQHFLLHLALILIFAKIASSISIKLKMPPVLGMLIIGIILGPSFLDIVKTDIVISYLAKIGVIMLLFSAGLETDIRKMKNQGKISFLTALGGVLTPFLFGYFTALLFGKNSYTAILIGTVLTATSVSVSVMTLLEMKRLHSPEGTSILEAAIIDDIIGILLLTFVFGLHSNNTNIAWSIEKIFIFFTLTFLIGFFLIKPVLFYSKKLNIDYSVLSIALAICFFFAWGAKISGVAEVTGAYFAGLFIGQTDSKRTVMEGIETLGHSFFVSLFFINIGLETHFEYISGNPWFIVSIIFLAILGKVLGAGFGAKLGGFTRVEALRTGIGMIPRGEVALIISSMALAKGIFSQTEFSTVVLLVVVSAIVTPFLLKLSFKEKYNI